jgi:hypothetical protein
MATGCSDACGTSENLRPLPLEADGVPIKLRQV